MFITTLPIIFTYTHLLSELEAGVFLLALLLLVYVYTPEGEKNWRDMAMPSWYLFLHAAWLGHASLWRAFWPFFIFVNAVLYYIDYRIGNLTYTIASWITVHMMLLLPIVWWIISVWRCSSHTRYRILGCAARTVTVCLVIEFILRILITVRYPNTLFDCQLLVAYFGDCR
ncbi:hypothetical protein JCM14076_18340 [Methylosoma difficile]